MSAVALAKVGGLSSAAVVNQKMDLREEKALVGFGPTEHSGIHIHPELVNPIYAAGYSKTTTNPKLTGWGASLRWAKK